MKWVAEWAMNELRGRKWSESTIIIIMAVLSDYRVWGQTPCWVAWRSWSRKAVIKKTRDRLNYLCFIRNQSRSMKHGRMKLQRVRGRQTPHKGWRGGEERRVWEEQTGGASIKEKWLKSAEEKGGGGQWQMLEWKRGELEREGLI